MTVKSISAMIRTLVLILFLSSCARPRNVTSVPSSTPLTEPPATAPAFVPQDPQVTALRQLEAVSETPPELSFQNGFPRFVSGSYLVEGTDAVERARNFLNSYQDLYRIANPDLGLAVRRLSQEGNEVNVTFYQTYAGIEVFASEIVVTLSGERLLATVGGLVNGDLALDTTPYLSAPQAEQSAVADLGLPEARLAGTTQLMIFDPSLFDNVAPEVHLVWRVTIHDPAPWQAFVDAQTGQVLYKYSLAQDGSGLEDFDFEEFNAGGGGVGDCYYFTGDHIGDEDGLARSWFSDPEAVAAWWYARNVYTFYHDTFGRHSYDNDDSQFEVFIRAGVDNAAWINSCDLTAFKTGWIGQDVLTHEFTHGVIASSSELVYANQPGALNESYADIMAALQDGNWTMGEGRIGGGGPIRDLSNPPAFLDPDRMSNFSMTAEDNGGVHTNSGINNKAAFLISVGGDFNGWTITGLGNGKLGALFYSTMISLGSNAQFIDTRNAAVARADRWALSGIGGFTSFDACQVQNAYAAVELGDGDTDCDGTDNALDPDNDEDYIPNSLDNCPLAANPSQQDTDRDGQGDACDNDNDNDGILNPGDNCTFVVNPGQQDRDGDGVGDACDDEDGDGVLDSRDNCLGLANSNQRDNDWDGFGDTCDPSDDSDGVPDASDNCPLRANLDQSDRDGDGLGDYCDNSPDVVNPDQADTDGDSIGDISDNCPGLANYSQEDTDRDGLGDRCDGSDEFSLLPDGSLTDLSIRGGPGQQRSMPIPVCLSGNCPDGFPADYLVSIVLTGLSPNVAVWVADDTGNIADRSPDRGDLRVLRFHPNGGRIYHLHFLLGDEFTEGQEGFMGSMSAGPGDEQPNPTPTGPPPTPLSPPPTVALPSFVFTQSANCRTGPNTLYPGIGLGRVGQQAEIQGISNPPGWYYVLLPDGFTRCFVAGVTGDVTGPVDDLPVIPSPPLPAPPAAPVLNVSNQTCTFLQYVVRLSWKDVEAETGYRVYRDGTLIATLGEGASSYDDNSLTYGSHGYLVEAYNTVGSAGSPVMNSAGCVY